MSKIIIYKREGYYWSGNSTPQLETLAEFFTSDVTSGARGWIDFVSDSKFVITTSNVSSVENDQGNIIVGDLLHDDDEIRVDTTTMPLEAFVAMLERWEELYKQKPDEIIIKEDDNGKISMIGKFADGREI